MHYNVNILELDKGFFWTNATLDFQTLFQAFYLANEPKPDARVAFKLSKRRRLTPFHAYDLKNNTHTKRC